MKREFLTEMGLEKEVIDKILNQHGTEMTAVKTTLTTKDTEISTLRNDLVSANTKVADLEKVDVQGLQKQLDSEKSGRMKDRKDFALKSLLSGSGCKDVEYLLFKLGDTVEFDDGGSVKDSDNLLKTTKEKYAAQFEPESTGGTGGAGNFRRDAGSEQPVTQEAWTKMGYTERYKIKTEQPEVYNTLMADMTTGGTK